MLFAYFRLPLLTRGNALQLDYVCLSLYLCSCRLQLFWVTHTAGLFSPCACEYEWIWEYGKALGCSVHCNAQRNAACLFAEYVSVCMSPLWADQNNAASMSQDCKVLCGVTRCLLSWSQGSHVKIPFWYPNTSQFQKEGGYGKQGADLATWEAPEDHVPAQKRAKSHLSNFSDTVETNCLRKHICTYFWTRLYLHYLLWSVQQIYISTRFLLLLNLCICSIKCQNMVKDVVDHCFPKPKVTSSNVLFRPQPEK